MTHARPFRAVRYDPDRVELSQVIVPPYDVITPDEREAFYDRDPHNAIRFELTRKVADEAAADYQGVADALAAWRESGVLIQDDEPAYYVMKQRFTAPGGEVLERIGFFAELGLEDYEKRVVRPHERTLAGPKADRLKVLRASKANLSCVFLLYEDREQSLAPDLAQALEDHPIGSARDDAGVEYFLARVADPAAKERVQGFMADHPVVIADGHHRYETAINYRNEQRAAGNAAADAPHESTLAFFANAFSPGSLLLPIHRVALEAKRGTGEGGRPDWSQWDASLPGWQSCEIELGSGDDIQKVLDEQLLPHSHQPSFAADDGSGTLRVYWRAEPLGDELGVRVIESDVLGGVLGLDVDAIREGAVSFPKSAARAGEEVREGEGLVALYLNALKAEDVFRVTGAGEVMPQKSTFFYPKIPTGMVLRVHEDAS